MTTMTTKTTKTTTIKLVGRGQSNRQWHRQGQPRWWARIGSTFLQIPSVRGDLDLDIEVTVPVGTTVDYGVGTGEYGRRLVVVAVDATSTVEADRESVVESTPAVDPADPIVLLCAEYERRGDQQGIELCRLALSAPGTRGRAAARFEASRLAREVVS